MAFAFCRDRKFINDNEMTLLTPLWRQYFTWQHFYCSSSWQIENVIFVFSLTVFESESGKRIARQSSSRRHQLVWSRTECTRSLILRVTMIVDSKISLDADKFHGFNEVSYCSQVIGHHTLGFCVISVSSTGALCCCHHSLTMPKKLVAWHFSIINQRK